MNNDNFKYFINQKNFGFSNENQYFTENNKNYYLNSLESNVFNSYNSFDNNPFNIYTSVNTTLQNSYIPLKNNNNVQPEQLKSTLFKQSNIIFKSKLLTNKPDKVNKIEKNKTNTCVINKLSIHKANNIFIQQQKPTISNKEYFSDEENLIDNIMKLKTILNEEKPKNLKNKNYKFYTDKDKKSISKIYDKEFNPENLLNKYKRDIIKTDKKDKAFQKLLKDYKKFNLEEEEINFSISDISKESIKTFHNCESADNSIKRNLFSENLMFSKDSIELSNIKIIRNETDSEVNHLTKDNTDFELTNFICTNNSERSSSIKKVKFLDDTELFSYDKKKLIYLSNKKFKRKKQQKPKSILIKRDHSNESEGDKLNLFKDDKLLALDSLNKLISECELENNLDLKPEIKKVNSIKNIKINTNNATSRNGRNSNLNCLSKNLFKDSPKIKTKLN